MIVLCNMKYVLHVLQCTTVPQKVNKKERKTTTTTTTTRTTTKPLYLSALMSKFQGSQSNRSGGIAGNTFDITHTHFEKKVSKVSYVPLNESDVFVTHSSVSLLR